MADMFLTISRCHVKAGDEMAARKLLEAEMLPGEGKKPSDVVPGLIGFGLMRAKTDPSMYGICTVWKSEEDFDRLATNPQAKTGGHLVAKLKKLCDGEIKGEGFYIESL
jgi:heme-degrading monooxygenase HmoA